jgi:hypothetical protein
MWVRESFGWLMPRAGLASVFLLLVFIAGGLRAAPAAELWPRWAAHDAQATQRIDHGPWQALLDRYLVQSPDGIHRFRYRAVDAAMLRAYLDAMAEVDPGRYARDEQMAYWINLYNALTVRVVLEHPQDRSIRDMGRGWFGGPWDDEVIEVVGQGITLNDIEHRILRPIWRDHRIHYAVNCASLGCPNLAAEAYVGERIDAQLDDAQRMFLASPRAVAFDPRGRLTLSSIFDWYREDFAADEAALLVHLGARLPALAPRLGAYTGRVRYAYDWSLNTAE